MTLPWCTNRLLILLVTVLLLDANDIATNRLLILLVTVLLLDANVATSGDNTPSALVMASSTLSGFDGEFRVG